LLQLLTTATGIISITPPLAPLGPKNSTLIKKKGIKDIDAPSLNGLNVPKAESVVKRRDDRSKNDYIPVQSTRKTRYLASFWCFRQKTRKGYDQLNHEKR
jgi:hypothetical protein